MRVAHLAFTAYFATGLQPLPAVTPLTTPTEKKIVPVLKAGHWEISRTESLQPLRATVEHRCIGKEKFEREAVGKEFKEQIAGCTVTDAVIATSAISFTAKCNNIEGITKYLNVKIEGEFQREFEQVVTARFNIPIPLEGAQATSRFKYGGRCPKDMAVGDAKVVDSGGRVLGQWNRYKSKAAKK